MPVSHARARWGLRLGWALAPLACTPPVTEPCGGRCGAGTECVADRCQPIAAAEPTPATPTKRIRKGKRGRKGAGPGDAAAGADAGAAEGAEAEPEDPALPPFVAVDDRAIPEFRADQAQTLDMKAGSERLSEAVLDQHFARVTPAIQGCVTTASRYGEVGSGSLKFKLRLLPSGKVEGVSVTAPASLRVWGIVPCARKAVFEHRFPAFDGMAMAVGFGVDID